MARHEFAAKLQAARSQSGLPLERLAEVAGSSTSFLSKLERGQRQPEPETVVRIALALGIDPVDLLHAAARDRLPDDLTQHIPGNSSPFELVRASQAPWFDTEVERLIVAGIERPDTVIEHRRIFEGLRPRSGKVIEEVVLQDPCAAASTPRHAVRAAPRDLRYDFIASSDSGQRTHRLIFPDGWRERPGASPGFGLLFECEYQTALGPTGEFSYLLTRRVLHLEVTYSMPEERRPSVWRARCTLGGSGAGSMDSACRSWTLEPAGARASLAVEEPLAGFTFGLAWEGAGEKSARPAATTPT